MARTRRGRRRRDGSRIGTLLAALVLVAALAAAALTAVVLGESDGGGGDGGPTPFAGASASTTAKAGTARANAPTPHIYGRAPASKTVSVHFAKPPASGLLVDERTGKVLWSWYPERALPIASITKMMTALLTVEHEPADARVPITRAAVTADGSKVGMLPRGKLVKLETLLYGLLLPSGNDAATALAQKVAHTLPRFVALMNQRARQLGLTCTRFASPSGIVDRDNSSCAPDLALLAHELLAQPRLAKIVRTPSAVLPLPVKGGKVWLYNNNGLMRLHYPGVDGVKTGYTDAAGRCLVAAAHRGRTELLVVILHSVDPPGQAKRLLDAGFAAAPQ
jgi:D-alanyl-D-alanine carboxypeptidase (penicillin-binding protein 5/6)